MKYYNINTPEEIVNFQQAVIQGIGSNKGLFVPHEIPVLPQSFFEDIEHKSDVAIAFGAMRPYISAEEISDEKLMEILSNTLNFNFPLVQISENFDVLELFHGPTMAFKDVGARFMANCLSQFSSEKQDVTILVATSGDTGSAVANGFHGVKGVKVIILFPKSKVSEFQQYQMTSLGDNITAVEVDGNFDDCQALVKRALHDAELNQNIRLSTANSINVARFLPQMIYYFLAYKQLKIKKIYKDWVVSVPSGNFGNITAGLYAKKMGLPIQHFIAANNANDTFYQFLKSGKYVAKDSKSTYSNAMDVGDPSNFVRIMHLYQPWENMQQEISGAVISDDETLKTIHNVYEARNYLLDPHAAVGFAALAEQLTENQHGTVLATASPKKFENVIQKVIPDFPNTEANLNQCSKIAMKNDYAAYKNLIMNN